MSTSTSIDRGFYIEHIEGEPTWDNPVEWKYVTVEWKPGTPQANEALIRAQASNALTTNRVYLGKVDAGTATTQDAVAQVAALTRQNQRIIRLLLGLLDGVD